MTMKAYLKLMRPHHWIKNLLVVLPLMCSGHLLEWDRLCRGLWAFWAFSLLASSIYIINDIRDRDRDRQNPTKCHRPIAAGLVTIPKALGLGGVLFLGALLCGIRAAWGQPLAWLYLGCYFALNLGYSLGLKNVPLLDIAILASGFLLRMFYGSAVTDIQVSQWLYLTVLAVSFYMGLGKRRNELIHQKSGTRPVLKYYSEGFLDRNMYMCLALAILFYSLWTMDAATVTRTGSGWLVWTVPLVILLCMRYSLNLEGDSDGDPVEVLLHDRVLLGLALLLGAAVAVAIYI
jgi:4-hydroxybenzoate polyprenyltransferase